MVAAGTREAVKLRLKGRLTEVTRLRGFISYSSVWSDSSVNNADTLTFGVNPTKRV